MSQSEDVGQCCPPPEHGENDVVNADIRVGRGGLLLLPRVQEILKSISVRSRLSTSRDILTLPLVSHWILWGFLGRSDWERVDRNPR